MIERIRSTNPKEVFEFMFHEKKETHDMKRFELISIEKACVTGGGCQCFCKKLNTNPDSLFDVTCSHHIGEAHSVSDCGCACKERNLNYLYCLY